MHESLDADHFEEVSAVFERMAAYDSDEPHWYLPIIGSSGPPGPRLWLHAPAAHVAPV
jgi:hypothetical protein